MYDHNDLFYEKLEWNCMLEAMEADCDDDEEWEDDEDDEAE